MCEALKYFQEDVFLILIGPGAEIWGKYIKCMVIITSRPASLLEFIVKFLPDWLEFKPLHLK